MIKKKSILFRNLTYRSWYKEAREKIEERIECCCKDGCYLVVWGDGNSHHSVVREVKEGEEIDEEEPEEFDCSPFKGHHGIYNECIISSLNKYVRYFTNNLHACHVYIYNTESGQSI